MPLMLCSHCVSHAYSCGASHCVRFPDPDVRLFDPAAELEEEQGDDIDFDGNDTEWEQEDDGDFDEG